MIEQSESIVKLTASLLKVQAQLKPLEKDAENPFFKSKYTTLSAIWDYIRPILADHDLCIVQMGAVIDGKDALVTQLIHSSGEWIRGVVGLNPVKNDPQAIGSAITYQRRYGISAVLGLCPDEDDDGESASGRGKTGAGSTPPPQRSYPEKKKAAPSNEERTSKGQAGLLWAMANECFDSNKKEITIFFRENYAVGSSYELPASCFEDCKNQLMSEIEKRGKNFQLPQRRGSY